MIMRNKSKFLAFYTTLILLLGSPVTAIAENGATATEISKGVIERWQAEGAEVGWFVLADEAHFWPGLVFQTEKPRSAAMPAFHFDTNVTGRLDLLPTPEVDFGISFAKRTDRQPSGSHLKSMLKQLSAMHQLRALDLSASEITDDGTLILSEFPGLHTVDMAAVGAVSNEGLKNLLKIRGLTTLRITRPGSVGETALTGGSPLDAFMKTSQLVKLSLQYYNATNAELNAIANGKDLVSLNLAGNDLIDDKGLNAISGLPKLKHLNISGTSCRGNGLAAMTSLETLVLPSHVSDAVFDHIEDLIQLRRLDVSGSKITDEGAKRLSRLKNLESLNLSGTKITDEGVRALASLNQLRELNFSDTGVTGRGVDGIQNLRSLTLSGSRLKHDGLVAICSMRGLQHLDISNTRLPDEGLALIANLTTLNSLNLSRTQITGDSLSMLIPLTELLELDISRTRVSDSSLSSLPDLQNLELLSVESNMGITDDVFELLARMKRLRVIRASWTRKTYVGVQRYREMFPQVKVDYD